MAVLVTSHDWLPFSPGRTAPPWGVSLGRVTWQDFQFARFWYAHGGLFGVSRSCSGGRFDFGLRLYNYSSCGITKGWLSKTPILQPGRLRPKLQNCVITSSSISWSPKPFPIISTPTVVESTVHLAHFSFPTSIPLKSHIFSGRFLLLVGVSEATLWQIPWQSNVKVPSAMDIFGWFGVKGKDDCWRFVKVRSVPFIQRANQAGTKAFDHIYNDAGNLWPLQEMLGTLMGV